MEALLYNCFFHFLQMESTGNHHHVILYYLKFLMPEARCNHSASHMFQLFLHIAYMNKCSKPGLFLLVSVNYRKLLGYERHAAGNCLLNS